MVGQGRTAFSRLSSKELSEWRFVGCFRWRGSLGPATEQPELLSYDFASLAWYWRVFKRPST